MKKKIGIGLVLFLIVMQFVPLGRPENSEAKAEIQADPKVKKILERSCYNCHSNHTEWPAYSYVFPVSLLVIHDVNEAREHLNFSNWEAMNWEDKSEEASEIVEEVEEGEMPLEIYVWMHPEAKLSKEDIQTLKDWSAEVEETYFTE